MRFPKHPFASGAMPAAFLAALVLLLFPLIAAASPEGEDQKVIEADQDLIRALAKTNAAAASKLFDTAFSWTDNQGNTMPRSTVLTALAGFSSASADQKDVETHSYGDIESVQGVHKGGWFVRIWVKRPTGWKLLVSQDTPIATSPAPPNPVPPAASADTCQNPCKAIPYKPKSQDEKDLIESWQHIEFDAMSHNAEDWAGRTLDEFTLTNSATPKPFTKEDRIAIVSKGKGGPLGPPPAPLTMAKFYDFGENIVMIADHQPYIGKPYHSSRIWAKRGGVWKMAFSYQTTIVAAPAK